MRVLAINGSPRKDGNTSIMVKAVFDELNMEGIETEEIIIGKERLRPCIACDHCWKNKTGKCVFNDDSLNSIIEKMKQADGLILASPVYVGDVSGPMKTFMDRAVYVAYGSEQYMRHKVGASIVAARRVGGVAAINTINNFFTVMQMPIVNGSYWTMGLGRDEGEVSGDFEGINIMTHLGRNMAWLIKSIEFSKELINKPETTTRIKSLISCERYPKND